MTRPVPRRHAFDPADSGLFERQEAALSLWAEKLKERQRLFAEREHVFEGTRLALGGPRRRRVLPPAALPAPEHPPRRVGFSRCASAAPSLAAPLLADTPPASCTGPSASPRHSGSASHLGSTEAPAPEARLCTLPALSSRRERRARRHRTSHSELQHPVVSETDFFLSSHFKPETVHYPPNQKTVCCDDILDYPINTHHSASKETVPPSQATAKDIIPATPNNFSHSITISSPITQPFFASTVAQIQPSPSPVSPSQVKAARAQPVSVAPPPVPAPRTRAAVTQSTSAPVPVSRVGVTGVQPPPVPVPAPRLKAARTQPDLPRGSEEPASPPVSSPLHPPPDPAFHALALSLVRLAEVSPAQAPALLAQAVALSPSLAQSVAQPLATSTTAPSSASPTSVHPLASPLQSVPSPAVQLPLQSVPSPAVQPPLQSVHTPAVQPPLQSVHTPAVQPPAQPSPVLQPVQSVVQSVQSVAQPSVAQPSVAQSLVHRPVQFPELQPQHPEPAPIYDSVVASAIFYGVVCWGGSISAGDRKRLNRLIQRASSVLGCPLDPVEVVSDRRMAAKLSSLLDNISHPMHETVTALSSSFSGRLRHPRCGTERFRSRKSSRRQCEKMPGAENKLHNFKPSLHRWGVC
ncbi:unnamed protein product [Oreochromis niloticus]|nr:unnamed protein product [Mustela putorius furo]